MNTSLFFNGHTMKEKLYIVICSMVMNIFYNHGRIKKYFCIKGIKISSEQNLYCTLICFSLGEHRQYYAVNCVR